MEFGYSNSGPVKLPCGVKSLSGGLEGDETGGIGVGMVPLQWSTHWISSTGHSRSMTDSNELSDNGSEAAN
ncbi:hypothetical protein OPV22_028877 [Ensete ventricosum]|uniref:Uncharacterized protein n=1 Tax=Ensete ventricosum TaxID=4639 RepID=A0AAV8QBR5_ENSVE|nr:hypothetical protein OPV22_028877 [Ensete ventricosum]